MLKNIAPIQIQKVAIYISDRKIINLISNKSFRYHNLKSLIIFWRVCISLIPPDWRKLGGIKGPAVEQLLWRCFPYLAAVWGVHIGVSCRFHFLMFLIKLIFHNICYLFYIQCTYDDLHTKRTKNIMKYNYIRMRRKLIDDHMNTH